MVSRPKPVFSSKRAIRRGQVPAEKGWGLEATVTSKGQFVLPAAIRRRYHIRKGTRIRIEEVDRGILLRPITDQSIEKVRGMFAGMGLPEDIEKEPDRDIR